MEEMRVKKAESGERKGRARKRLFMRDETKAELGKPVKKGGR